MACNSSTEAGGGFLPPSAQSLATRSPAAQTSTLPEQRAHPLVSGSMKETRVINHIDDSILAINRRHAKKFSSSYEDLDRPASDRGYEGFGELAKDVETIVDLLWVTGTRMFLSFF